MHLIPTPQKILQSNEPVTKRCVHLACVIDDCRLLKAAQKLPISENGIPLYISCKNTCAEGYRLHVSNEKITIEGDGVNGAFYGIQTLRQIFENKDIFCLEIEDKPKNEFRILYYDITRGKVPTIESMKQLIDDISYFKLNGLQFYVEHAFPFKEMYGTIDERNYLTPDEIVDLDNYCYEHFIDFVPSLATCGHMYRMLELPQNAHLREIADYKPQYMEWYEQMLHHTINPSLPESFEFVKSLIDQYIPLFSSEYVNICGDEPFDLKIGQNKAAGTDVDQLYFDFMKKVIDYVKSKGKKVMMWADQVFLDNADRAQQISDDVIMLCWGYAAQPPETRVQRLEGRKNKKLVCPSNSSYFRLCENAAVARQNICNMALLGEKYSADGMANTNWGDYGHPCSLELSMFGIVLGAQKSWDFGACADESFNAALDTLLYKDPRGTEYLFKVNALHEKAQFFKFARFWSDLTHDSKIPHTVYPEKDTLAAVSREAKALYCELDAQKWELDNYRQEMLLAVEGTALIAELFAKFMGAQVNRWTNAQSWLKKYRESWLRSNKESELCRIEELFLDMENMPVK